MFKTFIYILGTAALHFADFNHPSEFNSLFLPLICALFLVFLIWQLMFFSSLYSMPGTDNYGLFDLLADIWDFRYDVEELGFVPALMQLALKVIDALCFMLSVYYGFGLALEMISL